MAFHALSNEMAAEIVRKLESTSDLSNITLCSHRLYEIAQPFLYSTITQTTTNISAMIRTFLAKPFLSRYVKHFICTSVEEKISMSVDEEQRKCIQQEWLLKSSCDSAFIAKLNVALFDINCNWDSIMALLLLLFSQNLQSITILSYIEGGYSLGTEDDFRHPAVETFMNQMARLQRQSVWQNSMSSLRTISISCGEESRAIPPYAILPYLDLPSVASFTGGLTSDDSENDRPYLMYEGRISMDDVLVRGEYLNGTELGDFLRCFSSLKRFKYEHSDPEAPPEFRGALSHLSHCLEELTITCLVDEWEIYESDAYETIGSLSEFENLKTIQMSANILIGREEYMYEDSDAEDNGEEEYPHYHPELIKGFADGLPDSLETLTVINCTTAIFDYMAELFVNDGHMPPKLRTLRLAFHKLSATDPPMTSGYGLFWEELALKKGVVLTKYGGQKVNDRTSVSKALRN